MNEFETLLAFAITALVIIILLLIFLYVSSMYSKELVIRNEHLETENATLREDLRFERRRAEKLQNKKQS